MSIADDAFSVIHEDLVHVRPEYVGRDVILCPICLREIERKQVMKYGIEHIIPRVVTRGDQPPATEMGTLNQRSGITILCRSPRELRSGDGVTEQGCNGFKGRTYDWAIRFLLDERPHLANEFTHRHGVAILTMGYLGAFQTFGYGYALSAELDGVREQFDFPDKRVTPWLDEARIRLPIGSIFVATELGQPFGFGMSLTALMVFFRRCWVTLPPLGPTARGVRALDSLLPKLPS